MTNWTEDQAKAHPQARQWRRDPGGPSDPVGTPSGPPTPVEMRLILPGSIRSKKNSKQAIMIGGKTCPRRPTIIPSKAYQIWERAARASVFEQIRPGQQFDGPIHVRALCFIRGPMPDLSGCLESVGDCLNGLAYEDDRQIVSWDGSRVLRDKGDPRTEVTIWRVENRMEGYPMWETKKAPEGAQG